MEPGKIREEMQKMTDEPLLPIEIALIKWSLIIGGVSLLVLVWISYTFFPAGG